jgi:hypothetical protein
MEVGNVVIDVVQSVFFGHPRSSDSARAAADVEPMKPFGGYNSPSIRNQIFHFSDEKTRVLGVAVQQG